MPSCASASGVPRAAPPLRPAAGDCVSRRRRVASCAATCLESRASNTEGAGTGGLPRHRRPHHGIDVPRLVDDPPESAVDPKPWTDRRCHSRDLAAEPELPCRLALERQAESIRRRRLRVACRLLHWRRNSSKVCHSNSPGRCRRCRRAGAAHGRAWPRRPRRPVVVRARRLGHRGDVPRSSAGRLVHDGPPFSDEGVRPAPCPSRSGWPARCLTLPHHDSVSGATVVRAAFPRARIGPTYRSRRGRGVQRAGDGGGGGPRRRRARSSSSFTAAMW